MSNLVELPESETKIKIFFFDTDACGVVHNVAYLRLIEIARSELAEKLGWPLKEMERTGIVPVVIRTEIDYKAPARLGDIVHIVSRLCRVERIRFQIEFELRKQEACGQLLASCLQTLACVKIPGGKPAPIPLNWAQAYPWLAAKKRKV
ncbi:acyl-CoA thioesterase [Candidatus Methylacidiphilum infernorum]|uniref:Thioesterase superfamily enzyme n=1 Tax=Methylacidiphilum infernorum (isolate V4) TaxID=481448 RepID=B3DXG7_METI4|nr:thioesterase family protein [Candidatus Methylacidiphilum infernorum]ACD83876.1 Thioesterase superfamily enzyme [Methylacidiphilum infernorum V4]